MDEFTLLFTSLALLAYLLGSIPSAVLTCRLLNIPDPRHSGSQNPGATNVLRVGGTGAALLTLVGDISKGVIPIVLAQHLDLNLQQQGLIGIAAVVGHIWPVYSRFEGGKGVATAVGVLGGLNVWMALIMIAVWLMLLIIFRFASIASIGSAIIGPILAYWLQPASVAAISVLGILMLWRHRRNIMALINGTEPHLGHPLD